MKSLQDVLLDHRARLGADQDIYRIWIDSDAAFYLGAAAMAEQFAAGQGSLALMVKELSIALAREAQALHTRLRQLEDQVLSGTSADD